MYCSYFSNLVYIHIYLIILCLSIYLSVCVSSNACISLFLTIWLSSIYMPVSSFICLFIFICFVYLYRCPSTCLYIPWRIWIIRDPIPIRDYSPIAHKGGVQRNRNLYKIRMIKSKRQLLVTKNPFIYSVLCVYCIPIHLIKFSLDNDT